MGSRCVRDEDLRYRGTEGGCAWSSRGENERLSKREVAFFQDPLTGRSILHDPSYRVPILAHSITEPEICPFCPGNESLTPDPSLVVPDASGGWKIRVIPNRYPILDGVSGPCFGTHEVIVEGRRHSARLVDLSVDELSDVVLAWSRRHGEIGRLPGIRYVLLFRNDGGGAGASLEHPHSQIIGMSFVPPRVVEETMNAARHHRESGRCLFCDLLSEAAEDERVVFANERFVVVSPPAPRLPFEAWLFPRDHERKFSISPSDAPELAAAVSAYLRALAGAAPDVSFNFCLHDGPDDDNFHWHFEFLPRLASVAASEWGSGFYVNPVAPREATRILNAGARTADPKVA